MDFPNPYATDPSGAKPIPGVIEQQWATVIEVGLRMFGIHLYVHEHDGLASFIGAFLRAYPSLKEASTPKT
jgi:hypothetical protein